MLTLTALNNLLGTKFKLVSGYEGSAQIRLAVERNEVQGTGSTQWRLEKDWMRQQKLRILYQTTLEPNPELPGVPTVKELGRDGDERKMLGFFSSYTLIGRSILAPPGVPADRIAFLRAAFDATVADPGFKEDAKKANLDLVPLGGEKLEGLIADAVSLPGPLLERARRVAGR
jgi:tripartite-type tricarboxylate transporter receptor subunit TctC